MIGIVGRHHDGVTDHTLLGDALLTHLAHRALEIPVGKCIDRKLDFLTFAHVANIGFIHRYIRLQMRQILRDREERRGLETRGDALADADLLIDDHSVDW